jgi:hypothetical protein
MRLDLEHRNNLTEALKENINLSQELHALVLSLGMPDAAVSFGTTTHDRELSEEEIKELGEQILALDDCLIRLQSLFFASSLVLSIEGESQEGEKENTVFGRLSKNRKAWDEAFAKSMNQLLEQNQTRQNGTVDRTTKGGE